MHVITKLTRLFGAVPQYKNLWKHVVKSYCMESKIYGRTRNYYIYIWIDFIFAHKENLRFSRQFHIELYQFFLFFLLQSPINECF
jgi:hypothetical protein